MLHEYIYGIVHSLSGLAALPKYFHESAAAIPTTNKASTIKRYLCTFMKALLLYAAILTRQVLSSAMTRSRYNTTTADGPNWHFAPV